MSPMEKGMVLRLFFEVVMLMIKDKKYQIKDTVSTKTSFMHNIKQTRVIKGTLMQI